MTISAAVAAAAANDVIEVEDGTYNENVTISQALTLQSANGRSVTTIVGSDSGPAGTILINSGTSGVTIDGFTIVGFDNVLNGAIEYAAVYLRGAVTNTEIINNEIVANGEAGLLSEYNAAIDNIYIDNNIFSGITYNLSLDGGLPGECGFATQFDNPNTNVPRQLVVMGGGGGVTNSMNVTFTNNQVIGKAGDASAVPCNSPLDEQGNTLVTIDVINATITGNSFTGMTTRFASMLRTRGINTTISNNDFDGTNIGPVVAYVCIDANALDGATPSDLDGVQGANTFDPESFVNLPALCIYKCTPPAGFNQVVFNQDNCYGETDAGLRGLEVGPAPGADEVGFWRILEFIPGPGSDLSSFAPAPGGTGTGGPFSNADNASTSAEFEISADGSTFTPVASPTGASGNPLYGTYVLEVVVRNTVSGCESDAFGPLEKVMAACDGSFVTAAPCGCLDNATTLSNGQFSQLFTVEALPGQTINATAASGLYATGSPAPPLPPTPLTVPTAFTETATPGAVPGTVVYELQAIHVDGAGYTLEVSDGTSTASVSNTCYYPNPEILGLADEYCANDAAVPLSGQADRGDGGGLATADSENFDILDDMGATVVAGATQFDPGALGAGVYTVKYTFDAEELSASIVHEQGFEDPGFAMGGDDWNANGSNVTREVSGTNSGASGVSITSADGAAHAAVAPASVGGAFTRLGGYSSSFGNGFRTSLDVYLDLSDPAVGADTYGWDLSSAVSTPANGHRRDFIFHTAGSPGQILVAGSNNTNFTRRNDLASINHYTVTASGWYTFEWVFRDAGGGVLAVDLNLKNASGTILWTETRSDPSDIIGSTVGGNRYIWFTFTETSYLPIDNTLLEYDADGFPGCSQMVTQEVAVLSVEVTVENAWICADETLTALPPGEGLMAECMVDPISVLVVGNVVLPVPGFMADIQSKLISDPRFSTVDVHDITLLGVPTLAQLQNYDAVLAFVDGANPPAAYGTVLKDYADAGGAIVNMASSNIINNVANYALSGTWPGSPYPLITTGGSASGTATLGTVYDAAHPTMQGVASFNGGTFSGRNNTNTLIGGATRIADWSDGNPLVVVGEGLGPNSVRRAALNFYPPSSDVFAGLLWNSSTDGALLMANALYWVANPAVCEVIWYDGSDNVVGMGEVFDPVAANELDPGVPGDYSFFAECSCNGCASARTEAIFTVRPIPVVQPVADIMACPGAAVGDILLTSLPADVNTTFDWTVSDASDVINLADGAMGSAGGPNPAISGITANNASGTATISVTATLNGCQGDPIIITIMVGDGEMPVISGCPGNINLNTDAGLCTAVATWIPPTANDNCDGPLMPSGNYAPGAVFPVGMTMVTYNVSDAAGNAATPCSFTVTVRDKEDPEARCRDIDIVLGPDGTASISPGDIDNGSSDACGIESLSLSQEDFTCGDVGANSIRLTVTDENGNEDKCTATVTVESLVEDNTDPVARCEDATVHLDNDGEGDIDVSDIDDGSYDNCRIASLSLSKRNFDCDDIGENTVTLTVIDISGNDSECTATVTVEDNRDPDADCRDITVQLGAGGSASISPLDVDGGSSDNCGIEARRLSQERFTCSDLGANNIRLTIIDESGNDGWCTATVTVEAPPVAPILYVDASASPGGDGSSWNQAYDDLQDALGLACGCASGNTQIWVADGTYTPSQRVDFNNNGEDEAREAVFQLCDGVAVFGGFEGQPGTEGDFSVRNPAAFVSILSGDRNGNDQDTDNDGLADDNLGDNAYHVVSGSNTGPGAILDGFTVTGGRASGSGINEVGGGMLNFNGSPSVANCVFVANTAESSGGGMANFGGSPNLYDCIFSNNTANQGGGMYNSSADPYLGNCLFAGNAAESTGGGMANRNSEPELANNTFSGNAAGYRGGALYNSGSSPELLNCILWNNLADGDTQSSNASIYNQTGSAPRIAFSLVANSGGSGGWDAALGVDDGDNIDTDPLFFLPLNPANAPATFGDVHLQPASPAIDAGANNGATPAGLDGNPRPMDGDNDNVPDADMGVYEYPGTCPAPIAQCQDIFVQIGVNGLATVDASQLDGGSSGCAPFSFTAGGQATLSFGCGDIGPNGLILEVTDAFNASDACAVTVTVEDGLGVCPCTLPGDDQDMDGICDGVDNCPSTYNPNQYDTDQDGTGDACSQSVCLDVGIGILINYVQGLNLDARAERAVTARLGWAALRFCAGSSDASVIAVLDNLTAYLQSESGDDIPAGEAVYLLDQVDRLSILIQAGMAECCSPVPPAPLAGEGALPSDNWLDLEPMEGPSMDVFPNPFSSQATVRFFLPQEGRASLEVFNLQGQRLGILAAGAFEAGSQEVSWDGSADGGKALESGVYLLRLITEDGILAKRVSFVR